jgi:hypothetical protein
VPRLSIVIPCLGGAAEFDATLVSVLQHRPADCEVLVIHSEPYDDPYELGHEVRFVECRSDSLVESLNAGVEAARGQVLHIIGCGLEVTEQWTEAALGHFEDPDVAAVSPIILAADSESLVAAGVAWTLGGARSVVRDRRITSAGSGRRRAKILGPTLAAAFYRREVVVALGGFDTAVGDELADVSLALDIRAIGQLHVCETGSTLIEHSQAAVPSSHGFQPGRAKERLFWRHAAARGLALSVGLHPPAVVSDTLRQVPALSAISSLVGRCAGLLEIGAAERHERHLATALEQLRSLAAKRKAEQKRVAAPRRRAA